MSGAGVDFELWKEEFVETNYLHECGDGGTVTQRLTGSARPEVHLSPHRCPGCGSQPMLMRAITPDELAALDAGLWPGLADVES